MINKFNKKEYKIFYRPEKDEYLIYNTKKQWEEGHTHIYRYEQALYLVDCAIKKKIPKRVNRYFLVSLIRISKDKKFIGRIEKILDGEEPKTNYVNFPKNFLKNK